MKFIESHDMNKDEVIVNVSNIDYIWFGETITGIHFKHGADLILSETKEEFKTKLTHACMDAQ